MICPKCLKELEMDLEGGWCEHCQEYFPNDVLDIWLEEQK